jgi:hypothetical protein
MSTKPSLSMMRRRIFVGLEASAAGHELTFLDATDPADMCQERPSSYAVSAVRRRAVFRSWEWSQGR